MPPLAETTGVKSVNTTERVASHEISLLVGDSTDLVLADQCVTADEMR
jgi:hypothetical protein